MATIRETIDCRTKRLRLTAFAALGLIILANAVIQRWAHGPYAIWGILLPMLPAMAVIWWLGRKLICPLCHGDLTVVRTASPIGRCPHCRADFNRPMPGK